jgi:hypothetical protein
MPPLRISFITVADENTIAVLEDWTGFDSLVQAALERFL